MGSAHDPTADVQYLQTANWGESHLEPMLQLLKIIPQFLQQVLEAYIQLFIADLICRPRHHRDNRLSSAILLCMEGSRFDQE